MKVNEFIEKYNEAENKDEFIKGVLKEEYIPFELKISDCDRIIKSSSYTNTEPNMFKQNSPSRKMLFLLTIINRYTEIEIDFNEALEEYNNLCMIEMDRIFDLYEYDEILPKLIMVEINRYSEILYDLEKDFKENERSIIGYLDTKLASLGMITEVLETVLNENISDETDIIS